MVDFTRAIKRPFEDLAKFIIGAVLSIIPIVNFIAMGYELKCAKTAMKGDYKLPEWEGWGDLFVKGLLSFFIGAIYSIPVVMAIVIIMAGAVSTAMYTVSESDVGAVLASTGIAGIFAIVLGILLVYILPSVMMTFVQNDFRFGAAFKVREIIKKTMNKDYLVTWLVLGVYTVFLSVILSFVPIIGTAIASFAAGVTSMTAFGEFYPKLKA